MVRKAHRTDVIRARLALCRLQWDSCAGDQKIATLTSAIASSSSVLNSPVGPLAGTERSITDRLEVSRLRCREDPLWLAHSLSHSANERATGTHVRTA